jgi:TolB protein
MFRTALATIVLAATVAAACSGSASGAFPGNNGLIAFVNDRNGTPSIYAMDSDGTNIQRLVPNMPQGSYAAASPDGKKIVFSVRIESGSTYSFELWTMDADGSHARRFLARVSDRPYAATWSPDGKKIAYYLDDSLWVVNANSHGAREITGADFSNAAPSWSRKNLIAFDRAGSIWVVNPKSGQERRVGPGSQPSWSPDGTKLAYVAVPQSGVLNDIYVMRADGRGSKRLTRTPNSNEDQPAWSSGGRWIVFTGKQGVYVMRSRGGRSRVVAAKGIQPSWTRGDVLYTRRTPRWSGFVLRTDLSGKHAKWLLRPRVDAGPTWSPDGSQLAFTRDDVLSLVDAYGGTPRSIGLKGADPAWSPDGQRLIVASGLDLVIVNADGSEPTPLGLKLDPEKYTQVSEPDWTAKGTNAGVDTIAFVATSTSGIKSIFVVELLTKTLELESKTPTELNLGCETVGASSPNWSPNGTQLAFACDQSIALSNSDGSNLSPLGSADNATLAWSPDGQRIVFSRQFGDHWAQLQIMNSDGTVPTELGTGPGSSDQPDWQPLP